MSVINVIASTKSRLASSPNDQVQQPGRQEGQHPMESQNAGPVCCNALLGHDLPANLLL